jgi:hypothetical protein
VNIDSPVVAVVEATHSPTLVVRINAAAAAMKMILRI